MSKKKVKIGGKDLKDTLPPPLPKINESSYWKLQAYSEAMEHDKSKLRLAEVYERLHMTETLLANEKRKIALKAMDSRKLEASKSASEFVTIRKEIENEIGLKLEDCEIDPETFEIRSN